MRAEENQGLRVMITEEIGRDELPESVWDVLVYRGHVEEFRQRRLNKVGLVRFARALLFYADFVEHVETLAEPKDEHLQIDPPRLSENERERSETLIEYLKLGVASHPEVLRLRDEYVEEAAQDGGALTKEQAFLMVRDSEVREGLSKPRNRSIHDERPSGTLEFFCRPKKTKYIEFYAGSFFERLNAVGECLKQDLFPFWSKAEATWAAVTGEVPTIKPVTWKVESRVNDHVTFGTISLTAQPWVPAETVTRVYQHLQEQVLQRRPRPVSLRNLGVFRFVVEQLQDLVSTPAVMTEPQKVSWSRMMERWNSAHPEAAYTDPRKFYRDCHRTANVVVRPYGPIDIPEETPEHGPEKTQF